MLLSRSETIAGTTVFIAHIHELYVEIGAVNQTFSNLTEI